MPIDCRSVAQLAMIVDSPTSHCPRGQPRAREVESSGGFSNARCKAVYCRCRGPVSRGPVAELAIGIVAPAPQPALGIGGTRVARTRKDPYDQRRQSKN